MNNALEELLRGIGSAVNDIREKVVEEPWFGRVVSDSASQVHIAVPEGEPNTAGAAQPGGNGSETQPVSRQPEGKDSGFEPGKE